MNLILLCPPSHLKSKIRNNSAIFLSNENYTKKVSNSLKN